jgi:hypothetical protein
MPDTAAAAGAGAHDATVVVQNYVTADGQPLDDNSDDKDVDDGRIHNI